MSAIDCAEKVAYELAGTTMSLEEGIESAGLTGEVFDTDLPFCRALDDLVFQCNWCGWWCDIGEEASDELGEPGEMICSQCVSEAME